MQRYRPDIDGLRAIAVISVVLFHAEIRGFGGGYVGVDVFFVISGFLITSLILPDLRQARFSIVDFYDRRIRRLFPALFTMILACWLGAYWLLLPQDFADFGTSAVWTTLFLSNIYFWQQPSYFGAAAELLPLLHTWSLAIEEQFYVFFPLALAFLLRFVPRKLFLVVFLLFATSFAISIWAVMTHPPAAFFLAPSRAWELLLGALLALDAVPKAKNPRVRNAIAFWGLSLVLYSVFTYTAETPFPGLAALVPCLGTALIIYGGATGTTSTGCFLSQRPIVFVGLISYSLYLWHWPVLVFFRHYLSVNELPPLIKAVAIAIAVGLAILSWRYVEQPFRDHRRILRPTIAMGGAIVMTVTLAVGVAAFAYDGLPYRFNETVLKLASAGQDVGGRDCTNRTPPDVVRRGHMCEVTGAGLATQSFLVWGDSHAAALLPAINEAAAQAGQSGLAAISTACPPFIGVRSLSDSRKFPCLEFNEAVIDSSVTNDAIKVVILSARWALYAQGSTYKIDSKTSIIISDALAEPPAAAKNRVVFVRGLKRSLDALTRAGKKVVIVGPTPEIGWNVPKSLAMQQYTDRYWRITPRYEDFLQRQAFVIPTLIELAEEYDAELIFPHKVLCNEETCAVTRDGRILYSDDNHLSKTGASSIYKIFEPIFQ